MSDPNADAAFDRERWEADVRLREREIAVKEREAAANAEELKRSRWRDPIVLAVLAATLAAGGNAVVALINGNLQRSADERRANSENSLQTIKGNEERQIEEGKAEAARILEMIKTADPDKAAVNLGFLLDAGLIIDQDRRKNLASYLLNRRQGQGPALPSVSSAPPPPEPHSYVCALQDKQTGSTVLDAMLNDLRQAPATKDRKFEKTQHGIVLAQETKQNSNPPEQSKSDEQLTTMVFMLMQLSSSIDSLSGGGAVRVMSSPDGIVMVSYATYAYSAPYGADFVGVTKNTLRHVVKEPTCADRPFK